MHKKPSWKKSRLKEHLRLKECFYIFCEGTKTEPNYFKGFKNLIEEDPIYKDMVLIQPCQVGTVKVIEMAEKYVKEHGIENGKIWCVYDKDDFFFEYFNDVVYRAKKMNSKSETLKYYAAWSNQCIEFWFILHFSFYTSNNDRSCYISHLNDKFSSFGIGKYKKNNDNIFNILMEKGNPKNAIKYAKKIISENIDKAPSNIAPGTKVYKLVEELAMYLPEEDRKKFI